MRQPKTRRLFLEQLEPRLALSSYYVSPTGNDNNAGTLAAPFQTLQQGASVLLPGDILNVEAGTYAGFVCGWDSTGLYGSISGTSAAPITIRKDPSAPVGSVVINSRNNKTPDGIDFEPGPPSCSYITIDGFTVTNDGSISSYGIRATQGTNITITNCNVSGVGATGIFTSFVDHALVTNNVSNNNGEHGFYLSNSPNFAIVRNNTASGNVSAGIQFNADISQGPPGIATNNIIDSNILFNNGTAGAAAINLDGFQNGIVENNLIYNEHSTGIVLYDGDAAQGSINNVIVNNTVLVASDGRWCVNINTGSTGNTLFNNIFYNASSNGTITIDSTSMTGFVSDHNVVLNLFQNNGANETLAQWQSQTGQDKNSIISTPAALFVNPAANNYQELATSPSVNAGVSSLAGHNAPTVDIVGTTRPQGSGWDIGAYELVSGAALATHFRVTAPASTTAGSAFSITVTALDSANNIVASYIGIVHFTSTDGTAVLPSNYTLVVGDAGVHTFTNGATLKTAGSQSVSATDTLTSTITGSASLTVNPATASKLVVSGYASPTTAGVSHSFTVTAKDAFGNTATGYTGTVAFTSSDSQAVLPANYIFASANAGVHSFSATLKTAGSQSITVTDTVTSSIKGSQTGITDNPAAASKLAVSGYPSPTTAGVSHSFTVTAKDAFGNTAIGYTGTVAFTSSDSQAVLPANYIFASADAGVHSFSATLKTAGSQSITVTDTVTSSIKGSQTGITDNPAAASKLAVSGYPSPTTAGVSHSFTVTAQDAFNNTATGYTDTVAFTSSDGQAVLSANYTFAGADAGMHSFSATLKTAGSHSITATDTVTSSIKGSQTGITVNPAAASKLVVSGYPSPTTAGASNSFAVTAQDAFSNTATSYTGTIAFTGSDGQALLPANYTFAVADAGVHSFSATLKTAGSQSITATDTVTATITGTETVTVNPATGAATSFVITGYPSAVTAGTANNLTVTVEDSYGNTVPGYTGTVTFTSTALKVVLPVNYTFTGGDAGVHTFSATLRSAGTQSLTAMDTVNANISGSQTGIVVNPAATNHLVVSRFPSPTTAGASQTFRVTAQDMFGNTTPSFADTVSFSSSDGQALLPANYTFVGADGGMHTLSGTLKTAGSQSITAQDVTNANVAAGAMSGITVNPAAVNHLQVSGFPSSVIAGTAHSFTVTALDILGNVATGYRGTVTFGSTALQSILPGSYLFTSTDAGVHVFSATLNTQGSQSITATDTVNAGIGGTESGIVVVSVQPTAGVSGSALNASGSNGVPGQPLPFTLTASESGLPSGTVYSYSVQWGDGSPAQTFSGPSGMLATHAFPASISYTITVTATDPSGNGSLPASTSVSLTTLAMETDPYNANLTALYLGGTTGSDNIAITPVAGNGVKIGMNMVNYGSFFPTGHVVVYSQAGNDVIKTAAQTINGVLTYVNVPVLFFAGNGADVLNVSGSSASNVLVGGGGADRLIGGQGQDILIGGAGQATLTAGAGGDILIGGTTAYDNNAAALAAVLAEWSRTDIDYASRIAHLTGTIGGMNVLSGTYFFLNPSTVHGNGLADNLYGGAGLDWYFAAALDVISNHSTGEVITPI